MQPMGKQPMSHILIDLAEAQVHHLLVARNMEPTELIPSVNMRKVMMLLCGLLLAGTTAAQVQPNKEQDRVEIVATTSEYVPTSTTVSHPGHSFTDCSGNTSYLGSFSSYGDFGGTFSGSAQTNTTCNTTFTPPSETTRTSYRRVNCTIAKGRKALYLLSCTQTWKPTVKERVLAVINGELSVATGEDEAAKSTRQPSGTWTQCPAITIGTTYSLTVRNTSDARLRDAAGVETMALEYLSSAALPGESAHSAPIPQEQDVRAPETGKIHITSTPTGSEIYIDVKFYGNTPSDITLPTGDHLVTVTFGRKQWSRMVHVSSGNINLVALPPEQ